MCSLSGSYGNYFPCLQVDRRIKSKEIDEIYADIMVKIDNQNNLLRSQLQVKAKR